MSYNAIEINSMTRTYANLAKCFAPNRMQPAGPGFADKIADKLEGLDPPAVSPKDMTMEEYKEYIYNKISQIALHPSQSGWQWHVKITDEGFEAMKNDPEYEAHVLSAIRANFSFRDPFSSWNYSVLHFGASEEESYGESFGGGSRVYGGREETYWERRQKRRKKLQEILEEIQEKKAIVKRIAAEKYDTRLMQIKADPDAGVMDMRTPDAVAAYEANILADLIARKYVKV